MKVAFVTLATGAYTAGASVLFHSIKLNISNKVADFFCISDCQSDYSIISQLGGRILDVASIDALCAGIPLADRFKVTLRKLEIFNLANLGYDRIVYLDADTLVRQSIDVFFSEELSGYAICAVRDYACHIYHPHSLRKCRLKPKGIFNSGLLIINTKLCTFDVRDIVNFIKKNACSYDGSDQGYLNSFVQNQIGPSHLAFLNAKYNYAMDPYYPEIPDKDVVVSHFTGVKPWVARPLNFSNGRDSYLAWFYCYFDMMRSFPSNA